MTTTKTADAMGLFAAGIASLPKEELRGILFGEFFRRFASDGDDAHGGAAAVLADVFAELPDGVRTEAIANLVAGLFHRTAFLESDVVENVMRKLHVTGEEYRAISEWVEELSLI
jgi:hypothetical protein